MFYCYILTNTDKRYTRRTYCGYTVNPKKRLKQHKGALSGGAKATSFSDCWKYLAIVSGMPDKVNSMQLEWKIKNPDKKHRYRGPEGRIKGLNTVLKLDKWTKNSTVSNKEQQLSVWILQDYAHLLTDLPENITVYSVEEIEPDIVV